MSTNHIRLENDKYNPYEAPASSIQHSSTNWVFPHREIRQVHQLAGNALVLVEVCRTPSMLMHLFGSEECVEQFAGGGGCVNRQMLPDEDPGTFRELKWLERLKINGLLRDWNAVHEVNNS